MICKACCDNRHEECVDVKRQENFEAWATELCHIWTPESGMTREYLTDVHIPASRPYSSCDCQHYQPTPGEIFSAVGEP